MTILALVLLWAALNLVALIAINRYRDSLEQQEPEPDEVIAHIGPKQLRRTPTYLGRLHRDGRIEGKWLP